MIWKKIPQTPFACHAAWNGNKGGCCLYSTTLRHVIFLEVSREHLPHFTACEAYHLEPFWSPLTCSQMHVFHNRPCATISISEFLLRGICKQFKAVPHKQMWEPPDHRLPLEQTKIWCYSYLPVPVRVQTGNLVFPLMSTTFFFFFFLNRRSAGLTLERWKSCISSGQTSTCSGTSLVTLTRAEYVVFSDPVGASTETDILALNNHTKKEFIHTGYR